MSARTAWLWIAVLLIVLWGGLALIVAQLADARPVSWNTSTASVYDGLGLGGRVACKGYWPGGYVVAHKTLRCGTRVRLMYRARKLTARVWDRGPYVSGREFDLDVAVQRRLRFPLGVAPLKWRVIR